MNMNINTAKNDEHIDSEMSAMLCVLREMVKASDAMPNPTEDHENVFGSGNTPTRVWRNRMKKAWSDARVVVEKYDS